MPRQQIKEIPYSLQLTSPTNLNTSVQLTQNTGLPIFNTTGYSVAGWFNPSIHSSSQGAIIGEAHTTQSSQLFMLASTTGADQKFRVTIRNNAGVEQLSARLSVTMVGHGWHSYVWVDNGGDAKLYIDGVLDAQNYSYTPVGPYTFNTSTIGMINRLSTPVSTFAGHLSTQVAYSRVLTPQEISDFHVGIIPTAGRKGQWNLSEGTGTNIPDVSGNGNTGTIVGASYSWATNSPMKARQIAPQQQTIGKTKFANLKPSLDGKASDVTLYGESTQATTPTPDAPVAIANTTGNVTVRSDNINMYPMQSGVRTFQSGTTAGSVSVTDNVATISVGTGRTEFSFDYATNFVATYVLNTLTDQKLTTNGGTYTVKLFLNNIPASLTVFQLFVLVMGNDGSYIRGVTTNNGDIVNGVITRTVVLAANEHIGTIQSYVAATAGAGISNGFNIRVLLTPGTYTGAYEAPLRSTQTLPLATTQLRSLPNGVSDRIYKSGGSWWRETNVGAKTLDGSESWVSGTAGATHTSYSLTDATAKPQGSFSVSTLANILSDKVAGTSWYNAYTNSNTESLSIHDSVNQIKLSLLNSRLTATTSAGIKAWLATNPLNTIYQLATPTTTQITEPTTITALESIRTYQGITNITASTPVSGSYGAALRSSIYQNLPLTKTKSSTLKTSEGNLSEVIAYGESTQATTPTPDAPVAIASTTGNVTVKTVGVNLLPESLEITPVTIDGITISRNASGFYSITGTKVGTNFTTFASNGFPANSRVLLKAGVTYTTAGTGGLTVTTLKASSLAFHANYAGVFTPTEDLYVSSYYWATNTAGVTNSIMWPMLMVGNGAFTSDMYKPHATSTQTLPLSTTQLRSLPNGVSDRIYKSGGSWWRETNVGVATINGSEAWSTLSTTVSTNYSYFYTAAFDSVAKNQAIQSVTSDRFQSFSSNLGVASVVTADSVSGANLNATERVRFFILTSRLSANTVAAFKTWLGANNTVIQYELATPTTTQITDSTTITALENIKTYQGITTITASTPISGSYPAINRSLETIGLRRSLHNIVYNGGFDYAPIGIPTEVVATSNKWIDGTSAGTTTVTPYRWNLGVFSGGSGSALFEKGKLKLTATVGGPSASVVAQQYGSNSRSVASLAMLPEVLPNTSYTLSGYIKTENISNNYGGGAVIRVIQDTISAYTGTTNESTRVRGTTDWQKFSITFTTQANTVKVEVGCAIMSETGTAWFDELDFRQTGLIG